MSLINMPAKAQENLKLFARGARAYDFEFIVTTPNDTFAVMQRCNGVSREKAKAEAEAKVHQRYPNAKYLHCTGSKAI